MVTAGLVAADLPQPNRFAADLTRSRDFFKRDTGAYAQLAAYARRG